MNPNVQHYVGPMFDNKDAIQQSDMGELSNMRFLRPDPEYSHDSMNNLDSRF